MRLLNPTDDELNAAFAEKVAGWTKKHNDGSLAEACGEGRIPWTEWYDPDDDLERPLSFLAIPRFTESANAVLPYMPNERHGEFWTLDGGFMGFRICVRCPNGKIKAEYCDDVSFARAACIALLRSKGVEVEFT